MVNEPFSPPLSSFAHSRMLLPDAANRDQPGTAAFRPFDRPFHRLQGLQAFDFGACLLP